MLIRRQRPVHDSCVIEEKKPKRYQPLPPLAYLREHLEVRDGELWWKKPRPKRRMDLPAGGTATHGYRTITLDGRPLYAHRVIYYLQTGEDPGLRDIDHRSNERADNSSGNIRPLTHAENMARKTCKGYSRVPGRRLWRVRMKRGERIIHSSYHRTEAEAIAVRRAVEQRFIGHLL